MEKVSIIVPVYKVEKWLPECIESILNQTYKNFELILVDDGSPDNSGRICDEYAKKDERIKVFHIDNGGASHARNYGVSKAEGEYIGFIDSDDYIYPDMYETLYNNMKKYDAEISIINTERIFENGEIQKTKDEGILEMDKETMLSQLFHDKGIFPKSLCSKLIPIEMFKEITSPEGYTYEDTYMSVALALKAKKAVFDTSSYKYVYRMTPNSVSTSSFSIKRFDQYYILKMCKELVKDCSENILDLANRRVVRCGIYLLGYCYGKHRKTMRNNPKTKELLKEINSCSDKRGLGRLELFAKEVIKISPDLWGGIYRITKRDVIGVTKKAK